MSEACQQTKHFLLIILLYIITTKNVCTENEKQIKLTINGATSYPTIKKCVKIKKMISKSYDLIFYCYFHSRYININLCGTEPE